MNKLFLKMLCLAVALMLALTGCGTASSSNVASGGSESQGEVESSTKPVSNPISRTDYRFKNAYGYSVSAATKVDFGVINNCNLYGPGDEIKYFIDISGKGLNGKVAHIEFYNEQFGVRQSFEHAISTDDKGKQSIDGALSTEKTYKNGIYTFECVIDGFDKPLLFNIGIVPKAARASDEFYYGVQPYITRCKDTASHLLNYQNSEDTTISKFATIDYMGCNIIREEVTNFGRMWDNKDKEIDPTVIESDIKVADALGITYL